MVTPKKYKLLQTAGVLTACVAIAVFVNGETHHGALWLVAGFALYAIGRFLAWWHHG